jgi:hypothetical protein
MAKKKMNRKRPVRRNKRRRKRIPDAFPETFTTSLKYVEVVELDCEALGAPKKYEFRANSIYDPNLTGVGHQPIGRDQFAALYDHYTVIGSKMKATFYPKGDYSQNVSMFLGGMTTDTTNTFTSVSEMLEQSGAKGNILTKLGTKASVVRNLKYSPRKMFKIGKGSIIGNDRITTQVGTNPTEDAIFQLFAVQPDGSSIDPAPIKILVEIEYLVVFSERRPLAQS